MDVELDETVEEMVKSLWEHAQHNDMSLKGITEKNWQGLLDDTFNDGGQVRCELFIELADPYALQFGDLDSNEFNRAMWECVTPAIRRIVALAHGNNPKEMPNESSATTG